MIKEFEDAYKQLSLDHKRDKLSNELLVIDNILNHGLSFYGVDFEKSVKNYDIINDSSKAEDEMLEFIYSDVYLIEQKMLTFLELVTLEKSDNDENSNF